MPLKKAPKNIPQSPGVYYFKNEKGEILYIGKAKNLKKRVSSYFQKQLGIKNTKMISKAENLEYTTVKTELEAIILESNLIKEHQPKYNIIMKDDKSFVYIRISLNEDFPRIEVVRKLKKDKAKYLGPKTAAHKVKKTLKLLKKLFPYRHCGLDIEFLEEGEEKHKVKVSKKIIKYPCIDYYIKRCSAPCIGQVTPKEYQKVIQPIVKFLEGDSSDIKKLLEEQMKQAAIDRKFEKAAQLRDKLLIINDITSKQVISGTQHEFLDILGVAQENKKAFITLFQIRDGKLIDQENFILENESENSEEVLESFIRDYYQVTNDFPKEILTNTNLENKSLLEEFLEKVSEKRVKVSLGQRGKRKELLELAQKNAEGFLKQQKTSWEAKEEPGLEEIKKFLDLKKAPERMEAYDISHLGGTNTVGSMVVFKNGLPSNAEYRHFRIKSLADGEIDDFASLKEVFGRRLLYIKQKLLAEKNEKDFSVKKLTKKLKPKFEKICKKEKINSELSEDQNCYTLLRKEKIIGFLIKKENKETSQIELIYMDKKYLAREAETLLLEKAIKETRSAKIYIKTQEPEKYQKLGWKESKKPPKILTGDGLAMIYEKGKTRKSFIEVPDLILVDGGKGQLAQLVKMLKEYKIEIPAISLAKREEEIFIPGKKKPIILEANNPGLRLLQRMRNEAHRFAIEHQKKSRKEKIQTTSIDSIPGIGPTTRNMLIRKFKTIENIKAAKDEELKSILNEKTIRLLRGEENSENLDN